jgi:hypothetical protein
MSKTIDQNDILGTWKLVGVGAQDLDTGEQLDPGENPTGFINYGADGRVLVITTRGKRPKPQGVIATDEEAIALFRTVTAYAGRYSIVGSDLQHHVEVSSNEYWTNTTQIRHAKLEDGCLSLTTISPDTHTGIPNTRTLFWKRIQAA